MPTGTPGSVAHKLALGVVHTVCVPVVYTNVGPYTIGTVPAGAAIIDAGIVITTAFAGGTPQTLNIGVTGGDADEYGSALVLTAVGVMKADDLAGNAKPYIAADTTVTATLSAGATTSAGAGYVYVNYIIANRNP